MSNNQIFSPCKFDQLDNSLPISCPLIFFFFFFLGTHLWHTEVHRLRAKSELQLLAYTTGTATQGLSCLYDLHHSSQQCQILNPLRQARDQTHIPHGYQMGLLTTEPRGELLSSSFLFPFSTITPPKNCFSFQNFFSPEVPFCLVFFPIIFPLKLAIASLFL